ncbi:SCO family protein [Paucibacter sp. PLA-PC-4]|uniref:SCO family protein n=1 Tax=Paucibacter sp. PLA-PC-4 TaxID=2993655 RepID=UPI00224952CF|nr:SCO family protein [Paucibacter sp. PLA-PC-4]MCX2861208.1 SCO family protein [Paucibacter sp. PLA-PC-4]
MNKRHLLLGLAAISSSLLLGGCDQLGFGNTAKPAFKGVDLTGAEYARQLNLSDQDGQPRTLGDFKGKVLVVFFGFTQCPDVCPTTMAELAQVKKALGPDGDRVQGIFVTVDPERDTAALLKAYLASFDPSFVALRGSEEQTKAVAKEFKVYYAKVPGKTEGSYTMDHTAASFLFDAQGRVRVFSRYGSGAQALTDDLKLLLAEKA